MHEPVPAADAAGVSKTWESWHGSPELLAHVARVACKATERDGDRPASCVIDVAVANDHEVFASPSDFTANVTREALRNFKTIRIETTGKTLTIRLLLRWRRRWWGIGGGNNSEVVLKVSGTDEAANQRAFETIHSALGRGGIEAKTHALIRFLVYATTVASSCAAAVSAAYLLDLSLAFWAVMPGVAGGLAALSVYWTYPYIEVAPPGQTRLWRIAKFLGPIVITLILGAIAKILLPAGAG